MNGSAPGKIILLGEHAVVYGQPAVAIPIHSIQTNVNISAWKGGVFINSPQLQLYGELSALEINHPVRSMYEQIFNKLDIQPTGLRIDINSTIPVASGFGSGAALSVASIRSLATYYQKNLTDIEVNDICFATEKIFHGNPSGVDNIVITHGMPVYYIPGKPVEILEINGRYQLVVANTGIQTSTKEVVSAVRDLVERDSLAAADILKLGEIAKLGRSAIATQNNILLGKLMNDAHRTLRRLTISCQELDKLVVAARENGAIGAKLSGGGRGGNMIALCYEPDVEKISNALRDAGAKHVFNTLLSGSDNRIS